MTSIKLAEVHFALLDFICQGTPNLRRTDHIRAAIEKYVLSHEGWDLERFLAFAHDKYASKLGKAALRKAFLEDVKNLQARAGGPHEGPFPSSSALNIKS